MDNEIWERLKVLKAELYDTPDDQTETTTTVVIKKKSAVPSMKQKKNKTTETNNPVIQNTAVDNMEGKQVAATYIPMMQSPVSNIVDEKKNRPPSSYSSMFKKLSSDPLFLKTALKENHNLHKERDEDKRTLLHHISVTGNKECFMLLLESAGKQLNLHPKDVEGNTPLHCSCFYRHSIISEKLIELGCSTFRRNNMKQTPLDCYIGGAKDLLQLCNDADYNGVQELLSNVPTCVNKRDSDGWTALHTCAANGWIKGVDLLLRHGMKATLLDKQGRTPGILLQHILSFSQPLPYTNYPLLFFTFLVHLAARFGHGDIIHLLVTSTDDLVIDFQSHGKLWTPLTFACFHSQMYAAVVLIKCGANTQLKNIQNKTCFHYVMDDDKKKLLMDLAESMLQSPSKIAKGQELSQSKCAAGVSNEGGLQARPPVNSPPR